MSDEDLPSRRISILREDVSRKIAAGEVIDRPFSVVRELLDNAIDAQSKSIELSIEGGGISLIRVVDDGEGMIEEDLSICCRRYATSKIREEDDLYRVNSLGFRGEALAGIAACSRLEIRSMGGQSDHAHCLVVEGGKLLKLTDCRGKKGTAVDAADLFFNMPVRKKFLKSPSGETNKCRQALLEKALSHPEIAFRFFVNGRLSNYFPPLPVLERVSSSFSLDSAHLSLLEGREEGFSVAIVAGRPELNRRDRKMIQVFANRRRIFEYGLIQAVEYAFSDYMPGGSFPIAFVFLTVEPHLVDFNIHPTKREARFRNLAQLHQGIVRILKSYLKSFDISLGLSERMPRAPTAQAPTLLSFNQSSKPGQETTPPSQRSRIVQPEEEAAGPRYCGQLFRMFLLAEYGDSLFIVDQHAAHERLLYDKLQDRQVSSQELLLPIRMEISSQEEEELIGRRQESFREMGIKLERVEQQVYEISALPEDFLCLEEEKLIRTLLAPAGSLVEFKEELLSQVACRLAVKEGEELDAQRALRLIRAVFKLENARCPHGRPIWYEIRRDELLRRVGRA